MRGSSCSPSLDAMRGQESFCRAFRTSKVMRRCCPGLAAKQTRQLSRRRRFAFVPSRDSARHYLVPGLSRITWVFCTSARRLLRERIIDDTSSYQALHLHFHILRRPPRAPASVSLSRLARARPSSHDCVLVYCRPCIHLGGGRKQCIVNRALLRSH